MNTLLCVTHTYIDNDHLQRLVAGNFFDGAPSISSLIEDTVLTPDIFAAACSSGTIIILELHSKDDYREQIARLYEVRTTPTLLFLGSLSTYSEQMQEGMLKLLEEPPNNVYPVLFAHYLADVLPTIVSRSRIISLSHKYVMAHLNEDIQARVKQKLPPVGEFLTSIISSRSFDLPDFTHVEREELDVWLWQMSVNAQVMYTHAPCRRLAFIITRIAQARQYNLAHVQKKIAVMSLVEDH